MDDIYIFFDNRGTSHGQTLRSLHGDPNLGVLTALQQKSNEWYMHIVFNFFYILSFWSVQTL